MRRPGGRSARPGLLALVGASLGALGCAGSSPAQAAPDAAAPVVARERIDDALRRLDTWLAAGEVDRYLAAFAPDHPAAFALLGDRLRAMVSCGRALRRTSTIVGQPRAVGPRTMVRVRAELCVEGREGSCQLEDTIYAFRDDAGRAVPTFALDTPRSTDCPARDTFTCPPCNYSVGGVPGWFCVPMNRDQAQAVEASGFYLAGTDLACDVSVRVSPGTRTGDGKAALRLVEEMTQVVLGCNPGARAGIATSWWPPAHAGRQIAGLEGAQAEVVAADDTADGGPTIARFHVLCFGEMQHILVVSGSRRTLAEQAEQLAALLASFRLLELDVDQAELGARSLRHHVGGEFVGTSYVNVRHGVRIRGPEGWQPHQLSGGSAFCARWDSPTGSRLWLHAYAAPAALGRWCEATAERWLRQMCEQLALTLPDPLPDWQPAPDGAGQRCEVRFRSPPGDEGVDERRMQLVLHGNLLLVADGIGTSAADWAAIEHALRTLQF